MNWLLATTSVLVPRFLLLRVAAFLNGFRRVRKGYAAS